MKSGPSGEIMGRKGGEKRAPKISRGRNKVASKKEGSG